MSDQDDKQQPATDETETEHQKVEEKPEQDKKPGTEQESQSQEDGDSDEAWDPERAKRKIGKVNSENKSLRERATAAEKKAEGVDDIKTQNTTLGSENLRLKVGYKLGLPMEIAMRLQGANEDEMVKDAESLVELIAPTKRTGTRKPTEALRGGLTPDQEPEETDLKKIGARMFEH